MGRARRRAGAAALLCCAALLTASCTATPHHRDAPPPPAPASPLPTTTTPAAPVPLEPIRTLDACSLLPAKAFRHVAPRALLAIARKGYGLCAMTITETHHQDGSRTASTTVFHLSATTGRIGDDPRPASRGFVDWQSPRTVDGFTVYPGTTHRGDLCVRAVMVHHHHSVLLHVRSVEPIGRLCAVADAAVRGAIGAITSGTVTHLHWLAGSPAAVGDLCEALTAPVRQVYGVEAKPRPRTDMFGCSWALPGSPGKSAPGTPPHGPAVRLRASPFPPGPPPSGGTTAIPGSVEERFAGHDAVCTSTATAGHPDETCSVDFGKSVFPGDHIVVTVRYINAAVSGDQQPPRAFATAVTKALDRL